MAAIGLRQTGCEVVLCNGFCDGQIKFRLGVCQPKRIELLLPGCKVNRKAMFFGLQHTGTSTELSEKSVRDMAPGPFLRKTVLVPKLQANSHMCYVFIHKFMNNLTRKCVQSFLW